MEIQQIALPAVTITDAPDVSYRGMLVDVARTAVSLPGTPLWYILEILSCSTPFPLASADSEKPNRKIDLVCDKWVKDVA